MNFFIEHPYYSYLLISMIFGAFLIARFNPEELRIRADNFSKTAEALEKIQKDIPAKLWQIVMLLLGFLWIIFIPRAIFNMIYRIVFGSVKEEFKNYE